MHDPRLIFHIEFDEEQRQLLLLALGMLAAKRPGFDYALQQIAILMDNNVDGKPELYEQFKKLNMLPGAE